MTTLSAEDLALLRRFEPVICFNRGEQFYPMDADRFLAAARLCVQRPDTPPEMLVPRGELTAAYFAQPRREIPGAVYFLSVADPLTVSEMRAFRRTSTLREFHSGPGRLVRVGLAARFFALLFSLSLLLRGRVPGSLAAGSAKFYAASQSRDERYTYYGRVVRAHGYIALQYWFFYAYNDWRASFHGVNDHEGDWEMVIVYVAQNQAGAIEPLWLACSSHDSEGDDLRRRWDDPALQRVGEHPVICAGAGSHANYFFPGEYMPDVPLPFTQGLARAWLLVRRLWARLGQGDPPAPREESGFRIPFVDYARGDGLRIGPGQSRTWQLGVLQASASAPAPAWVDGFSGLWGHYSGDPLGENAPPGPRYERNGTERVRWYDPMGWCGLDKEPPPAAAPVVLRDRQRTLREEQQALDQKIDEVAARLAGLELQMQAQLDAAAPHAQKAEAEREVGAANAELVRLKAERVANELAEAQCARYAEQLASGDRGDPRAHLRSPALPVSAADLRLSRLASIWSAISVGVLLLSMVALLLFFSELLIPGALLLIGIYAFIEALFHRAFERRIRQVVVGLAVLTVALLIAQFFVPLLLIFVVFVGVFFLVENVRELIA
jgi:hypothetical protein